MKSAWNVCAILLLATGLVAQTTTTPKPRKPKPAPVTAADVQALKDAIASQQAALAQQQQQIQQLRDELGRKDQVVQQAQTSATELKGDVTDLKSNMANTVVSIQEAQKAASESPLALHYKGITITPGGFL